MAVAIPVQVLVSAQQPQAWSTGLCDCFQDCTSCCISWFCPCIQYGLNAEELDGASCFGNCCLYMLCAYIGCCCILHAQRRSLLRRTYNLQPDCDDCCAACCCPPCALAQESREIAYRKSRPPLQTMNTTSVPVTSPLVYNAPVVGGYPQQGYAVAPQGYAASPQGYVPPQPQYASPSQQQQPQQGYTYQQEGQPQGSYPNPNPQPTYGTNY